MAVFKNAVFYPETANFIQAASITDETQMKAIGRLVGDLKNYSLWDKMKAIYPFVGGTSGSHKFNLKDPRDSNDAFRLFFSGSWTHSSTGALPDGTTAYANTYYIPSVSGLLNSAHLSYYSRTTNASNAGMIGVNTGTPVTRHYIGQGASFSSLNSLLEGDYNPVSYQGLHLIKRENSTETKQFYNGILNTTSTISSTTLPTDSIYLACRNNAGIPNNLSTLQVAFASIGDGLTDTEAANLYTAVQRFQTTLGRQV